MATFHCFWTKADKSLPGLPFELLILILEHLEPQDVYNLLLIEPEHRRVHTESGNGNASKSCSLRKKCIAHNIKFGGLSVIECAARNNDPNTVKEILQTATEIAQDLPEKRNITSYAPDNLWFNVLTSAVHQRYTDIAARMLAFEEIKRHMIQRGDIQHGLFQASECGDVATMRLLIDNGADPEAKHSSGDAPLILTAIMEHFDAAELLLTQYEVDPNVADWDGITALHVAAQVCNVEMVKILLFHGAMVDIRPPDGYTALETAAENGNTEIVRLLLSYGADPSQNVDRWQTPLGLAAQNGHIEIVELLLDEGRVDPDAKNDRDYTPLMKAIMGPYEGIARVFLQSGRVNPNKTNARGETALHLALIWDNSFQMAEMLLSMEDIKPDEKDEWGITPIMLALSRMLSPTMTQKAMSIVTKLLATGKVDVNTRNRCDNSPLDYAIRSGCADSVKLLLGTGKVIVTSHELVAAHHRGDKQIISLLEKAIDGKEAL